MVKKLPETAQAALAQHVANARAKFTGSSDGIKRLINDLYTGRDPASGGTTIPSQGVPWHQISDPSEVTTWHYPQVGANLFQSRTRQLVTELVPSVPAYQVEALTAEATHLVEEQNLLMPWLGRASNLRDAMRQTAMNGLLGSHFGIKLCYYPERPIEQRLQYVAIPASHCGYEPQFERFTWHSYQCQWAELKARFKNLLRDADIRKREEPEPWQIVDVTEVFHPGFAYTGDKCPVSVYISIGDSQEDSTPYGVARDWEANDRPIGDYLCTEELPCSPLYIDHFLDPAPGEYIAPPEVVSWVPVIRSIHSDLKQLENEVGSINNIVLIEKGALNDSHIAAIKDNPAGHTLYVEVEADNAMGEYTGVSHKVRPVERNSAIGEIITSLQTHLQLLDEVVGVSSLDRGVAQNPRKSATEASAIVQANNRRTRDRLTVMANAFSALGQATYAFLPQVFPGGKIPIPLANGLTRNIEVPDPETARMAFRVEPVELGNLSKQGQIETHAASLTLLTNLRQQAPDLIPPTLLVESARKYLRALGNHAAADALQAPILAGGPQERIRDFIYGRTTEIPVNATDDHEAFIAAYQSEIEGAALSPAGNIPVAELQRALVAHQQFANTRPQQAEPQSPVAGFNAQGDLQNGAMGPEGIPIDAITELSLNQLRG